MVVDPFAERLARVRQRFISTLESKIEHSYADLPKLSGEGRDAIDTLGEAYRRMHDIAGVGPTIGFVATGRAAKTVENILLGPYRATRGLGAAEVDAFKKALHVLREAAQREVQTMR
jgi:hypothetical protein